MSHALPIEETSAADAEPQPSSSRLGMKPKIAIVAVVGVLAAVGAYLVGTAGIESTDDAQVDADIVAIQSLYGAQVREVRFEENARVHAGDVLVVLDDGQATARLAEAEARLAAAEAAARVADQAAHLAEADAVEDHSAARATVSTEAAAARGAGDQIEEAEAALRSAQAAYARAHSDLERQRHLFQVGAVPAADLERAEASDRLDGANVDAARARLATLRSGLSAARGRVAQATAQARRTELVDARIEEARARVQAARADVEVARAARDLAHLDLEHTRILAPHDGVVSKKTVAVGQVLSVGSPVAQLVTDERWVTANFKETQVERMQVGQPVTVTVDAFPGHPLHGHVQSFSGATGSRFTLIPPDNASGNFTKVVQRISVRVSLDDASPALALRPGMNVVVDVDTRGAHG